MHLLRNDFFSVLKLYEEILLSVFLMVDYIGVFPALFLLSALLDSSFLVSPVGSAFYIIILDYRFWLLVY